MTATATATNPTITAEMMPGYALKIKATEMRAKLVEESLPDVLRYMAASEVLSHIKTAPAEMQGIYLADLPSTLLQDFFTLVSLGVTELALIAGNRDFEERLAKAQETGVIPE